MEAVRNWVRRAIGYRSMPYRAASFLAGSCSALRREGLPGLALIRLANGSGGDTLVRLRSLEHPILVRPGSDDINTIINNILREEYGQMPSTFVARTIIDAGAYIGDTAAYFLTRFPHATVVALEPCEQNHARAVMNLAPYGARVRLLKRALWDSETTLQLAGHDTGATIAASGTEVKTATIPALMSRFALQTIDLLKLDIEGAEVAVIPSGAGGWLRKTGMILLETHGPEIERAVLPVLTSEGFTCRRHRNVWYCSNKNALAA